jgi:hypothetical protein
MRSLQAFCLFLVGLFFGLLIVGCQSRPTPTPEPTPTENVVVVVVTSTTQPTLAPTETLEATITPLATFTPIGLNSPTPTRRATTTPVPIRTAVATNTPKAPASATQVPPTATPAPDKYAAPIAISPATGDSNNERAEIQFKYLAVGPLRGNECYLLHVQMASASGNVPPAGDDFMDTSNCADQGPIGARLTFVLNRPKFRSPTFGGIEQQAQNLGATVPFKLQWYVRVVQNNGFGADGVHYNTIPLSPNSATLESEFWP